MIVDGCDTVAVPPALGSDAIIVAPGLEPVQAPPTMDEPKAFSSLPNDTTLVVALKGVQIKEPISEGETCTLVLREIGTTLESVVLCTVIMIEH